MSLSSSKAEQPSPKKPKTAIAKMKKLKKPPREGVVCDIKRHLRVHFKRGEHYSDDDGHAEIMHHDKCKFVTSANYPEIRERKPTTRRHKWCHEPGCTTICARLDKHLLRAHQMNIGSVPCKMYMREAKLYMRMMEMDENPRRVLAQAQPSTSSAAPQPAEEPKAAACEDDATSSEDTNICPTSASESGSEFDQESSS